MRFPMGASRIGVFVVGALVVVAATIEVAPRFKDRPVRILNGSGPGTSNPTANPSGTGGPGDPRTQNGSTTGGPGGGTFACAAGRNGGATDIGVTATQIRLASTEAKSGIGAAFLGDAPQGMLAVVRKVNAAGGICGRQLTLTLVDDAWSPTRGQQYIRGFIHERPGYFALAVVPSSEGLDQAVRAGDIRRERIPVVGSDGMLYSQYADPFVWPVATSTISTAHIAAIHAYRAAGARTFGVVYDNYKFGIEGADAYKAALRRLGGTLKAEVQIQAGQQDYSSDVQKFEQGCQPCDATFMLLEPDTAVGWINSDASSGKFVFGSKETSGPQPLFTSGFGRGCGAPCNNMWVWTGYQPPIPPFASKKAAVDYVNDIRAVSSTADVYNQFLEGSYIGMELLVEAMKKVGPNLTRARLTATLDSMTFDSGLTKPQIWRAGNHFANTSMLGFTIQYSGGFNGFQYQNTDWIEDPWAKLDHPE